MFIIDLKECFESSITYLSSKTNVEVMADIEIQKFCV